LRFSFPFPLGWSTRTGEMSVKGRENSKTEGRFRCLYVHERQRNRPRAFFEKDISFFLTVFPRNEKGLRLVRDVMPPLAIYVLAAAL